MEQHRPHRQKLPDSNWDNGNDSHRKLSGGTLAINIEKMTVKLHSIDLGSPIQQQIMSVVVDKGSSRVVV